MKAQKLIQLPALEGEQAPSAKLSRDNAQLIKSGLVDGESPKELAKAYGVSYQTVYLIGLGETWKSIEPKGRVLPKRSLVTPELRDKMFRWKRKTNATVRATAERYGVSTSAAGRAIKDGHIVFALKIQRAVLSSGTYDQVAKRFGIKRSEVDEFLAFEEKIPDRLRAELD